MSENGKGDSPRSCFSERFRNNFSAINWGITPKEEIWLQNLKIVDENKDLQAHDEDGEG